MSCILKAHNVYACAHAAGCIVGFLSLYLALVFKTAVYYSQKFYHSNTVVFTLKCMQKSNVRKYTHD